MRNSSREPSGFGLKEERVLHVAGRMIRGEIELGEIVVVGLDVRSLGDGKAHVGEDRGHFVEHLGERMHAADLGRRLAHRQRHIDAFRVEPRRERLALERLAPRQQRGVDAILQSVDQRPLRLAFFGRQRAERLQERRDRAGLAERGDAHCFERRLVRRGGGIGENLLFELCGVRHFDRHSGMNGRSVSDGLPPACVSMQWTWPR